MKEFAIIVKMKTMDFKKYHLWGEGGKKATKEHIRKLDRRIYYLA